MNAIYLLYTTGSFKLDKALYIFNQSQLLFSVSQSNGQESKYYPIFIWLPSTTKWLVGFLFSLPKSN